MGTPEAQQAAQGLARYHRIVDETPVDIRSDVREAAMPILKAVRDAGWDIAPIHWETRRARTLAIFGKSPSGFVLHAVWGESELAERLQALLTYEKRTRGR